MKTILKALLMASVLTGVIHSAYASSSEECSWATQSATCICFPDPVGCVDPNDPGIHP